MRLGRTTVAGAAMLITGGVLASTPWAGATAIAGGTHSTGARATADGARGTAHLGTGTGTRHSPHGAAVHPGDFTNPRQNPYFPLRPGTVSRYRGTDEGAVFRERLAVTHRTKRILGVRTLVIRDVLRRADGSLAEKTTDWYADDNVGNVWYFGERTATYDENGKLDSREGSWQAGVRGAVAGLIMPADAKPTDAYRQEFFRGHAEDQAWIVQRRHKAVKVPYGRIHGALRSFEWTRLEPGVISLKYYGRGLGIVRERDVAGGNERFDLVSVSHR